jgi:NAD(P)H-dependent flavin oxidoreductase YrpB (nitropropane dioxygenase family)
MAAMPAETIRTPLCDLLKIKYPVMVAGMAGVTGPELVAAASNAGGIGTIGAIGLSPEGLKAQIKATKALLADPSLPFGVDLLLPKTGQGAKVTNKDYTGGKLGELLDIVIDNNVPLFVCAVGVPPAWACEKLHSHGIVVMNMVGDARHCLKALEVGCDMICAQGTEGGGHTGEIATMPLIPMCVEMVRGRTNYFGTEVPIVAAGGIYNGGGLAAALSLGACGAWVGTAFLAAEETNIEKGFQDVIIRSSAADTVVQRYYSGRTMRVIKNKWVEKWQAKDAEAQQIFQGGIYPSMMDIGDGSLTIEHVNGMLLFAGEMPVDRKAQSATYDPDFAPMMAGQAVGGINAVRPVAEIMHDMVNGAIAAMRRQTTMIARL